MKQILSLTICTFLFISNIASAESKKDIKDIDWQHLRSSFEAYANYPTSSNADKVIAVLPKKSHVAYSSGKQEQDTLKFIYDAYQIQMLERQVISGDRESIRLAFNLTAIADGSFAEDLNIMLGSLIRINPKLFLEGLNEFQVLFIDRLDGLVGNLGPVFVDRLAARCYEIQLRVDSLSKVKEPSLQALKDGCIKSLQDYMKKYCKK